MTQKHTSLQGTGRSEWALNEAEELVARWRKQHDFYEEWTTWAGAYKHVIKIARDYEQGGKGRDVRLEVKKEQRPGQLWGR